MTHIIDSKAVLKMFRILCVCVFLAKYASSYHNFDFQNELINNHENDDDIKRKTISYFEQSPWQMMSFPRAAKFELSFESSYNRPVTIIAAPKIERTYRTEFRIQQFTHPYLFQMIQMFPIKGQISFQYIYQKLFQYFLALQRFRLNFQPLTTDKIIQVLRFVFPELGNKVYEIAKYPVGPLMLKSLFGFIFPGLSPQDINIIFRGAHTASEVLVNFILYLCPNIKNHFLWRDDLPIDDKLHIILNILFPGVKHPPFSNFQASIYNFLDMLFQGKLIPSKIPQTKPEGPEWLSFQSLLHQNNINFNRIPQEVLYYLFSNYKTPQWNIYLNKFKEKLIEENQTKKMDPHLLKVWRQYLHDLKTHHKTLTDMPQEIKLFLQQYENPQELIKILSDSIGFPVDVAKLNIPLDPKILELWKKFIFDILYHKGDTTHFPKPLLDYFNTLSRNPDYKSHLDLIFDALSINPKIVIKWNNFFNQLQGGHTTLNQMPTDLKVFLTNHKNPGEFLRIILKLKDSGTTPNILNIDTSPEILRLWKQYIKDVAENKGNIHDIPQELLQYFYKIALNPAHRDYIKLLFSPDRIDPKTLVTWNKFISDLKLHQVDLKDMPPEIIQLMLKYERPDDFFKVVLPQSNIDIVPDETVKEQWKDWTSNLQNHNTSIYDTPKELKDYFHQLSTSQNHQSTFDQIYSINPDLLMKWKEFKNDLEHNTKTLFTMPEDLKHYITNMKNPKEFVDLIFKGLNPPLDDQIPTPSEKVQKSWVDFLEDFKSDYVFEGEKIDNIGFPADFSKYLRNVSDNPNYKHDLNLIYKMDSNVKAELEEFKEKMKQDYNMTLGNIPKKLAFYFLKFGDISDVFRSILAAYPGNYEITKTLKINDEDMGNIIMRWLSLVQRILKGRKTEIPPEDKFFIKYLTIGTPLESQIDEVFKLHEANALVKRVEEFWKEIKATVPVHDGVEVFLQTLHYLGAYYGSSEELCEERLRIVDVLENVKNQFASKSECTFKKLLTKINQN